MLWKSWLWFEILSIMCISLEAGHKFTFHLWPMNSFKCSIFSNLNVLRFQTPLHIYSKKITDCTRTIQVVYDYCKRKWYNAYSDMTHRKVVLNNVGHVSADARGVRDTVNSRKHKLSVSHTIISSLWLLRPHKTLSGPGPNTYKTNQIYCFVGHSWLYRASVSISNFVLKNLGFISSPNK